MPEITLVRLCAETEIEVECPRCHARAVVAVGTAAPKGVLQCPSCGDKLEGGTDDPLSKLRLALSQIVKRDKAAVSFQFRHRG